MLSEKHLERFEHDGFIEWRNFIDDTVASLLRDEITELKRAGELKKAAIGKGVEKHIDAEQRGDFIHWIDPENSSPSVKIMLEAMEEIRTDLNRSFFLGIENFECHFTEYPAGTFYKKHVDRHRSGSPRIVSVVLYLNENWQLTDGGQLIVYHLNNSQDEIIPQCGTLVLFLSEKEHEVLTTYRVRNSITGWMRQRTI
ncbi:MAG: 2OG-Fe(II) oxygenase [Flavobacteriales bacterium]|nr:2OG-Fe(II) oxygenase [Flavobacteriales bacterium]